MSFDGKHFHHSDFQLAYKDTYAHDGLLQIDQSFLNHLKNPAWIKSLRIEGGDVCPNDLIEYALHLESWLVDLFGIQADYKSWQIQWHKQDPLSALKQLFFKKARRLKIDEASMASIWSDMPKQIRQGCDDIGELFLANELLAHPDQEQEIAEWLYCFWKKGYDWGVLVLPEKRDHTTLVKHEDKAGVLVGSSNKPRDGFAWTETPTSEREIYHEADYCIYCHQSETDFCRKGFPEKKGHTVIKKDAFDEYMTGCPLDEKISEMNWLMAHGSPLAAFIVVMMDNPMVPATGHRICNECMRSCIYQKQNPVNIPKIESFILDQVLALPWGVEIYDLLCRWHPLRAQQWILKPQQHKHVFIMGMGPAGFSLAHHLLMEGYKVFGADGLRIEALPSKWVNTPIKRYQDIYERGELRKCRGFGGVSEYGITARWDKNYLKLIQIMLLRRSFELKGSIRFGGNLKVDDVWRLGFHHLTIALGAGLPKGLEIPNSLAPGMRQANDFLMALHQGAYQQYSELEVRLPAIVIGSGLTAIDTATELQAYYIRQIERVSAQFEFLEARGGQALCMSALTPTQQASLKTMLLHAKQAAAVKQAAMAQGVKPYYGGLIQSWGGVSIVYRRAMLESPAYRLNPEEIEQGLNEGILYQEKQVPVEVVLDEDGHVAALVTKHLNEETITHPAGSIFVATGAAPNVAYTFENRDVFEKDKGFYATYLYDKGTLIQDIPGQHCKDKPIAAMTSYQENQHTVSVIGDGQKAFHGSVVRAIASAKHAYPQINDALVPDFKDTPNYDAVGSWFESQLVSIEPVQSSWVRVVLKAPSVASAYEPGNMIRIESSNRPVLMQFPYECNEDTLSFYHQGVFDYQDVSVMGPSGVRFSLPKLNQAVVLIDVDSDGVNAAIALAKTLHALKHEIIIVACQESLPILQGCLPGISIQSQHSPLPKIGFTHVWVFAHPDRVSVIESYKQQPGYFLHDTNYVAATYGPMQCMLKGVCAQCLQWQVDPLTGRRTKAVYACSWQHQPMNQVDWGHATSRRKWNPIIKHMNQLWFKFQKENSEL